MNVKQSSFKCIFCRYCLTNIEKGPTVLLISLWFFLFFFANLKINKSIICNKMRILFDFLFSVCHSFILEFKWKKNNNKNLKARVLSYNSVWFVRKGSKLSRPCQELVFFPKTKKNNGKNTCAQYLEWTNFIEKHSNWDKKTIEAEQNLSKTNI